MKYLLTALFALPLSALAADFRPSIPPTPLSDLACHLHHPVAEVESLRKLPGPIADFVLSKTDDMAERGAFFNHTDFVERDGPFRRFIRAGQSGQHWFVWFEAGGITYNKQIAVLSLDKDEKAQVDFHVVYFKQNPCKVTDSLLGGEVPKDLPFGDDSKNPNAYW